MLEAESPSSVECLPDLPGQPPSPHEPAVDGWDDFDEAAAKYPPDPPVEQRGPSWSEIAERVQTLAMERGHYEGYPLPDDECPLVVHKKFPLQTMQGCRMRDDAEEVAEVLKDLPQEKRDLLNALYERFAKSEFVNMWWDERRQRVVTVMRAQDGKVYADKIDCGPGRRASMALMTLGVSRQWDVNAEMTAMRKLQEFVPDHLFEYYLLTGTFLERSQRSNVLYVFRRCRPTLAIGNHQKVLCALCLHPIGYYSGSFGGAMVPTDDVITHLLLMRGDERRYWSQCNQHNPWMPEAGL